jgi:hypothetical protein
LRQVKTMIKKILLLTSLILCVSACAAPASHDTDPPVVAAPVTSPSVPADAASPPPAPMPSTAPAAASELKFSGVVGKVDTGCFADGVCFMEVDGKRVVFGMGWSREDWGQVAPREPIESYVGRRVEVYCGVREGVCSLVGNRAYYVR